MKNSRKQNPEDATFLVYMHTSPTGKSYIGQTNDYERRCSDHKLPSSGCAAFSSAIKKHGWDSFTHMVLIDGLSREEANAHEAALITKHNTLAPLGYNLKVGGGNGMFSDETRAKISAAQKRRPKESYEKQAAAIRGRKQSAEAIARQVAATTGMKRSEEFCLRLSKLNTGKKASEEARIKMSQSAKKRPPMTAETRKKLSSAGRLRKASPETREKMSASRKGHKVSAETLMRMSAAASNISDETRVKMAASKIGKVQSKETIAKRVAATAATRSAKKEKRLCALSTPM